MSLYDSQIVGSIYCKRNCVVTQECIVHGDAVLGKLSEGEQPYSILLIVEGEVTGSVRRNPAAKNCVVSGVIIKRGGTVGAIEDVNFADIAGTVRGDIRVTGNLILRKGCEMLGKAVTTHVYSEDGVELTNVRAYGGVLKDEPRFAYL